MNNSPKFVQTNTMGVAPDSWYGTAPVDGALGNWRAAPIGAEYEYRVEGYGLLRYRKVADLKVTGDWAIVGGSLSERISVDDFTDGSSTTGTLVLGFTIPAGATVTRCIIRDIVGFAGNSSAVATVGDGSDPDRYMTGTPSVFATAAHLAVGQPSGVMFHAAAISTVTVTVTTGSDFTACKSNGAGRATVIILFE